MKSKFNIFFLGLIMLSMQSFAQMAPFTKGNFVVVRLQNPSGSAGGIVLQEYSPTGTRVQQMSFDTLSAPNNKVVSPNMGSGETEYNYMSLSANGQYVTFGGFFPPASGNIGVAGNPRVAALIKYDGTVNTQTTFTGSSYLFTTASAAITASTSLTIASNSSLIVAGSVITGEGIAPGTTITAFNTGTRVATLSQAATVANGAVLTVELVTPATNFATKSFVTLDGAGIWASYSAFSTTANGILYQPTGSTGTPVNILASSTGAGFRQMNISPYDGNLYISRSNGAFNFFSGAPTVAQPLAATPPFSTTGNNVSANRGYCFVQPVGGGGEVMYVAYVASASQAGAATASTTAGSTTLTLSAVNANFVNGNFISGGGIPPNTTIVSGGGTTTLTLSKEATATLNGQTFYSSLPTVKGISKFYRKPSGNAWIAAGGFGTSAENYLTVTAEPKAGGGGFTIYATKFNFSGNAVFPTTYTQANSSTVAGSNIVTLGAPNANFVVGNFISGTGIPSNTTITAVSGSSVTISNNATLDGTVTLTTGTLAGSPCIVRIDDAADYDASLNGTETVIVQPQYQQVFRGISVAPMSTPISPIPLPLKLISFTGTTISNNVALNWTSVEEKNVAYFEVEKSLNGSNFTPVGKVAATNLDKNDYQFADPASLSVITFYRLKMVDKDGSFSYSNVLSFSPEKVVDAIKLYPNPASDVLNAVFSPVTENTTIGIYDFSGKMLVQKVLSKNTTSIQLNISQLITGPYLLKITNATATIASHVFIKN